MAISTSSTKPIVVIVPGSFSSPDLYSNITEELLPFGYDAIVVGLVSVWQSDDIPAASMADDAAHIRSVTSKLADQGRDIVLAMHSYGGVCGTESAKGLSKKDRESEGLPGGIIRLLYLTALINPVGVSLRTHMGPLLADHKTEVSLLRPVHTVPVSIFVDR